MRAPSARTLQFGRKPPFDAGALIPLVQRDGRYPLRRARIACASSAPRRRSTSAWRWSRSFCAGWRDIADTDRFLGALLASQMQSVVLPPQLHVFVRDWLSANNILLKSRDGHVLIDSGYVRHAPLTLALLESSAGSRRRAAGATRQHALPQRPHRRQCRDQVALRVSDRRAGERGARLIGPGIRRPCCSGTAISAPTASRSTR